MIKSCNIRKKNIYLDGLEEWVNIHLQLPRRLESLELRRKVDFVRSKFLSELILKTKKFVKLFNKILLTLDTSVFQEFSIKEDATVFCL